MRVKKFGAVYLDREAVQPGSAYTVNKDIDLCACIRDSNNRRSTPLEWIEVKPSLFVARAPILVNISWSDLGDQGYVYGRVIKIGEREFMARLPQAAGGDGLFSEWEAIVAAAAESTGNPFPIGYDALGMDIVDFDLMHCATLNGALTWSLVGCSIHNKCPDLGWRPVLEPMDQALDLCPKHVGLPLSVYCRLSRIRGRLVELTDYDMILDRSKGSIVDMYSSSLDPDYDKPYRVLGGSLLAVSRKRVDYVWENI